MALLAGMRGWRRIRVQNSIAKLHRELGDIDKAEQVIRQAIQEARSMRAPRLEGACYLTYAAVLVDDHRMIEAIEILTLVIEILEQTSVTREFFLASIIGSATLCVHHLSNW